MPPVTPTLVPGQRKKHKAWSPFPYSYDTLASFWCLFLVLVDWHQKRVSVSYFSGAEFFWCQKPAPDWTCWISSHHLRLSCFSFGFFNNTNAKTAAVTSSSSKFSKPKFIFVLFLPVSFAGKVSWFLAPDDWCHYGTGNRRQKMVNVSSTLVLSPIKVAW